MPQAFTKNETGDFVFMSAPPLDREPGVCHLFTTRLGGVSRGHLRSLNLGFSLGDSRENVLANYRVVLSHFGAGFDRLVCTRQVHGRAVLPVEAKDGGRGILFPAVEGADGLITNTPGLVLGAFCADCTVTLLYDPESRSIGAVHSGWRGTVAAILPAAVEAMVREYGANRAALVAAVGPSIGPCCFFTHGDVPEAFSRAYGGRMDDLISEGGVLNDDGARYRVDIPGINRRLLAEAGVRPERIAVSRDCTACNPSLYWSHRRTKGRRGVQGAFIMLK